VLGWFSKDDEPGRKKDVSAPYFIDPADVVLGEPATRTWGKIRSRNDVNVGG
jgi:hypothetical protein